MQNCRFVSSYRSFAVSFIFKNKNLHKEASNRIEKNYKTILFFNTLFVRKKEVAAVNHLGGVEGRMLSLGVHFGIHFLSGKAFLTKNESYKL